MKLTTIYKHLIHICEVNSSITNSPQDVIAMNKGFISACNAASKYADTTFFNVREEVAHALLDEYEKYCKNLSLPEFESAFNLQKH